MRTFNAKKKWDQNKFGSYEFKNFVTGGLTDERACTTSKAKNSSVKEVIKKVSFTYCYL